MVGLDRSLAAPAGLATDAWMVTDQTRSPLD